VARTKVAEGVWFVSGAPPARRRRVARRVGPVVVSKVPTPAKLPDEATVQRVTAELRRERLGAALAGAPGQTPDIAAMARRLCSGPDAVAPEGVLGALLDSGLDDLTAIRALWWVGLSARRSLVRHLLREERWPGPRVLDALGRLGIAPAERYQLFDATLR